MDNTYFASVVGASGGGFLECYKDYARRTQLVISPPSDNTPISARITRTDDGMNWTSKFLAICETPEVHELPLTSGFTGDLIYYKTQESICTVSGCIYGTFAKDSYISIGYLPEGFHSAHALELPVAASYGVGARCSIATDGNVTVIIAASGVAYVYFNISFPCA